jgi:hypothetical protein
MVGHRCESGIREAAVVTWRNSAFKLCQLHLICTQNRKSGLIKRNVKKKQLPFGSMSNFFRHSVQLIGRVLQRTRPQIFVDGKPPIPNLSDEYSQDPKQHHPGDQFAGILLVSQPVPGQYSDERGPNCRDRVDDSFRIPGSII